MLLKPDDPFDRVYRSVHWHIRFEPDSKGDRTGLVMRFGDIADYLPTLGHSGRFAWVFGDWVDESGN